MSEIWTFFQVRHVHTSTPAAPPALSPSSGLPTLPSGIIPRRQENGYESSSKHLPHHTCNPPLLNTTVCRLCANTEHPDTAETTVHPQGAHCLVRGDRHMNKISAGALEVSIWGMVGTQMHKWSVLIQDKERLHGGSDSCTNGLPSTLEG